MAEANARMAFSLIYTTFTIALLTAHAQGSRLQFRPDGTFKVLQFTDLHYGEGDELDAASDQLVVKILEWEKPDLAVLSGDMVSGYAWDKTSGWFEKRWKQLTQPFLKAGIPYAFALGNHDDQADLTRRQIVELDQAGGSDLALTQLGPLGITGASNYYLAVHSGSKEAARLWFLDSMDRGCGIATFGWGCVGADTIQWLQRNTSMSPSPPTTLAFIHIPIPQFRVLWNCCPVNGSRVERVNCPSEDSGVYTTFRHLGINAVYSGHDHNNNFFGVLNEVRLAYGQKSGYGSYGPPQGWLRGARVIELREGQSARESQTWLRMEDGTVVHQRRARKGRWSKQMICWPGGFLDHLRLPLWF